jgi:Protein of unknown function (DUF2842)
MQNSFRKLIGAIALLVFVFVYALLVMGLAGSRVREMGGLGEGAFFVFAGVAWLPIAMLIIKFMIKKDA